MARYFTLAEAESLLPKVERSLNDALDLYGKHEKLEGRLQETMRRIAMAGGAMVNRGEIAEMREQRDTAAAQVNEAIETVHSYGCQVKDLQMGLLDFPTLYRGAEVLLCWRLGEKGIHFWHGVEEGYRGRKPIDQDFLDNHRGDRHN